MSPTVTTTITTNTSSTSTSGGKKGSRSAKPRSKVKDTTDASLNRSMRRSFRSGIKLAPAAQTEAQLVALALMHVLLTQHGQYDIPPTTGRSPRMSLRTLLDRTGMPLSILSSSS